jgi:hypothetical protein
MMTPSEQREFVEDGRSSTRRMAFREAEARAARAGGRGAPLDEYLALLTGYQALFGSIPVSRTTSPGRLHRL